jgi:c(7)-type cytochrome triheme protein
LRCFLGALAALLCCGGRALAQDEWMPLGKDGLHDPKGAAIKQLQEPREALSKLPPDTTGNMVRWVEAIESGVIKPRASLKPGVQAAILDKDILLDLKGGMPSVLFPHKRHTEWLACANCHDGVFKAQTGATPLSMFQILAGEQCGICHGAVSFPLTECFRCHSVLRPGQARTVAPPGMPPSHGAPGER